MAFPTVVVEAGFTPKDTTSYLVLDDATHGLLDTGTLAGDVWTDISAYVKKITTRRGASRADGPILRYEAGTASIELYNDDGRFDPTNLAGPYVTAGATQVLPMLPIQVTAIWAGIRYEIFRGFADSWNIEWFGYGDSMCTVTATDATKVLSNYNRVALGSPVGGSEDSGARVNRILDSASWPSYDRDIAVGDSTLQATTMDRSAWEELLTVQDSEIGGVFVDAGGRVVFRNRMAPLTNPRSTAAQGVFGDGMAPGWDDLSDTVGYGTGGYGLGGYGGGAPVVPAELPYASTAISYDDTTIVNVVRVANVGGTQQVAEDVTSQNAYLIHTFDRTDLILQTDPDAADYAAFLLFQSKDPELRFLTLAVNPHDDEGALFPQVLGRGFGDRLTVVKRPPGGNTIIRDVFVRGVTHAIEAPNLWTTTFALQSATRWSLFTVDDPVLGVLDSSSLAY